MTGQPLELFRFVMFFLMLLVTGLMSQATGMLVAILCKSFLVSILINIFYIEIKLTYFFLIIG